MRADREPPFDTGPETGNIGGDTSQVVRKDLLVFAAAPFTKQIGEPSIQILRIIADEFETEVNEKDDIVKALDAGAEMHRRPRSPE